jgi:hypothetical protein
VDRTGQPGKGKGQDGSGHTLDWTGNRTENHYLVRQDRKNATWLESTGTCNWKGKKECEQTEAGMLTSF